MIITHMEKCKCDILLDCVFLDYCIYCNICQFCSKMYDEMECIECRKYHVNKIIHNVMCKKIPKLLVNEYNL